MEMTKQALLGICKEHQLYRTPSLNDKLYCNFKGFHSITPVLGEYSGLRALFLEGNALESMKELPPLKELRCLYLQQNLITDIAGLEDLEQLDTLNLSNNRIAEIDNLACCKSLKTLLITHNLLQSLDDVRHLSECTSLQTLDLQQNKIDDPEVLHILQQIPDLRCLYLKGNPVVSKIKNYRKTVISSIPSLLYLDDRPVFENERRTCAAWARGGVDAERAERQKIKDEEAERNRRNFEYMRKIREEGWRKRRERLGLPPGDTDPYHDELSDTEYEFEEEPEELAAARRELASYTGRQGEEEPEHISRTRADIAAKGLEIKDGNWDRSGEGDARIYFDSIKENQRELAQEFEKSVSCKDSYPEEEADNQEIPSLSPFSEPGHGVSAVVSGDT